MQFTQHLEICIANYGVHYDYMSTNEQTRVLDTSRYSWLVEGLVLSLHSLIVFTLPAIPQILPYIPGAVRMPFYIPEIIKH